MRDDEWKVAANALGVLLVAFLSIFCVTSVSDCTARKACRNTCEKVGLQKVITSYGRGLCICKDSDGNLTNNWAKGE